MIVGVHWVKLRRVQGLDPKTERSSNTMFNMTHNTVKKYGTYEICMQFWRTFSITLRRFVLQKNDSL